MRDFKIPSIPPTTNKCIRFPNDIIEQVEKEIKGKNCTFSAFVIEAVRVALDDLKEESKDLKKMTAVFTAVIFILKDYAL